MQLRLKLVVLGMFSLWCLLLWYISFHMDLKKAEKTNGNHAMPGWRQRMQRFSTRNIKSVQVLLAADEYTVGGMIAAINSIISNTKTPVHFYLITSELEIKHLKSWIEKSKLSKITYNITVFPYHLLKGKLANPAKEDHPVHMDYAKFYIPFLFPHLRDILVYIDNDVIVQGDIADLATTPISDGYYGAFSEDCQSVSKRLSPIQNTYSSYINFNNYHIKKLKLNPTACSFNTGVFVVNMTTWQKMNLTRQLERWVLLNKKEKIYVNHVESGGSQPPIMIVFYKKISSIDPLWHVRHLGVTGVSHYSPAFLQQARLLHWDGQFKPWSGRSANTELWDKYYLPDPSGHYNPTRKKV